MNFLFERNHKYETHTSIEDIRSMLKELRRTSWHDVAINLTGKLEEDDSFRLARKYSFTGVKIGLPTNYVLLEGQLTEDNNNTNIEVTVRSSRILLFYFYSLLIFLFYDLYRLFESNFTDDYIRSVGIFLILTFFIFQIRNSLNKITNSFERYLQVGKR